MIFLGGLCRLSRWVICHTGTTLYKMYCNTDTVRPHILQGCHSFAGTLPETAHTVRPHILQGCHSAAWWLIQLHTTVRPHILQGCHSGEVVFAYDLYNCETSHFARLPQPETTIAKIYFTVRIHITIKPHFPITL